MKPAQFHYFDPKSLAEAIGLLAEHGREAKLLAGGQSLLPVLNMRLARPKALIDLSGVAELAYIREEESGLAIGAMTRHAEVERSPLVASLQPLLTETVRHIGHLQIRNRGTIGGSLAHADPAAELPALLVALEGSLILTGPAGVRTVAAGDFFQMYFTTCLAPDEILTGVRLPVMQPHTGHAFLEISRRHGDFALAGIACTLTLADDGTIAEARMGLTGVGLTPVRAYAAEALLAGDRPGAGLFAAAGELVRESIAPECDIHATAEYRRHLAGVLAERALTTAWQRAERRALPSHGAAAAHREPQAKGGGSR